MTAYSLKYFEENAGRIVKEASDNSDSVYITLDNGTSVVLMPAEKYESWNETDYLLSNRATRDRLMRAIERTRRGEVIQRDLIDP